MARGNRLLLLLALETIGERCSKQRAMITSPNAKIRIWTSVSSRTMEGFHRLLPFTAFSQALYWKQGHVILVELQWPAYCIWSFYLAKRWYQRRRYDHISSYINSNLNHGLSVGHSLSTYAPVVSLYDHVSTYHNSNGKANLWSFIHVSWSVKCLS